MLSCSVVLLLLVSVTSAQFVGTLHELTTRHAVCLQHGEIIDVDAHDSASQPEVANGDSQSQLSCDCKQPVQGHHQHCLFVSSRIRRNIFLLAKTIDSIQISVAKQVTFVEQNDTRHVTIPTYSTAPKHSPPTV